MEVARAMLHDQKLLQLGGEVANNVVYVQNGTPHQALGDKTPEEVFTCVKLDVGHLTIFGYPIYFHVPKEKRNELKALAKKGVFFGYCENSKAYRIYVPGQRSLEFSRDVTFDEDGALREARDTPTPIERKNDAM